MSYKTQLFYECQNIVAYDDNVRVESLDVEDDDISWFKVYRGEDFLFEYYRNHKNSDSSCTIKTKEKKYSIEGDLEVFLGFEWYFFHRMLANVTKQLGRPMLGPLKIKHMQNYLMRVMRLKSIPEPEPKDSNYPLRTLIELCKMLVNNKNSFVKMVDIEEFSVWLGKERVLDFAYLDEGIALCYSIHLKQSRKLSLDINYTEGLDFVEEALEELKELCLKKLTNNDKPKKVETVTPVTKATFGVI